MSLNKCPICGEYILWSTHTCDPCFYVFIEDDLYNAITGEAPKRWFANDAERAAIKFCESDYEYPNEMEVWVITPKEWNNIMDEHEDMDWDDDTALTDLYNLILKKCKHFEMESEIVRNYYGREMK